MPLLNALTLTTHAKSTALAPHVKRRYKLIAKLEEPRKMAQDSSLVTTKSVWHNDADGTQVRIAVPKHVKRWWTAAEYAELEQAWAEQQELRVELKDKPNELKRYEEKLKQATFHYNRAKGYSSKGKHSTAKVFYAKSETCCEEAIKILHEILQSNPYLQTWFDRHASFDAEDGIGADVASLPRLVTSRSHESLGKESRISSKLDVKLSVVERAMDRIGRH